MYICILLYVTNGAAQQMRIKNHERNWVTMAHAGLSHRARHISLWKEKPNFPVPTQQSGYGIMTSLIQHDLSRFSEFRVFTPRYGIMHKANYTSWCPSKWSQRRKLIVKRYRFMCNAISMIFCTHIKLSSLLWSMITSHCLIFVINS